MLRSEREYGYASRSFTLASAVDEGKATRRQGVSSHRAAPAASMARAPASCRGGQASPYLDSSSPPHPRDAARALRPAMTMRRPRPNRQSRWTVRATAWVEAVPRAPGARPFHARGPFAPPAQRCEFHVRSPGAPMVDRRSAWLVHRRRSSAMERPLSIDADVGGLRAALRRVKRRASVQAVRGCDRLTSARSDPRVDVAQWHAAALRLRLHPGAMPVGVLPCTSPRSVRTTWSPAHAARAFGSSRN